VQRLLSRALACRIVQDEHRTGSAANAGAV
jgi:hypothetical protein